MIVVRNLGPSVVCRSLSILTQRGRRECRQYQTEIKNRQEYRYLEYMWINGELLESTSWPAAASPKFSQSVFQTLFAIATSTLIADSRQPPLYLLIR
jgi:hypothetical protein